jgi:hypothetical protein
MALIHRMSVEISPTEQTRRAQQRFAQLWKNWR